MWSETCSMCKNNVVKYSKIFHWLSSKSPIYQNIIPNRGSLQFTFNFQKVFINQKCYLNDLIVSYVAYVCTPEVLEEQNSFCAPNPSKASISCKLSKVLAQTWIFFLSCIFVNFDTKRGMPDSEEVAAPRCSSSRMIWHHICSKKLCHQIRQELQTTEKLTKEGIKRGIHQMKDWND